MLKEDYTLPPNEDDPEYVEKRNRVMVALMDFLRLLEEREMNANPAIVKNVEIHRKDK